MACNAAARVVIHSRSFKERKLMAAIPAASSPTKPKTYRAIVWGGLIAGTLDITAAFIQSGLRGISPFRVLRYVAGGLLGVDAFKGGLGTVALGAVLHFTIATGATTVYYVASRKLDFLVQRPIVCGLLYGVAVYGFMNLIVLPLSALPKISYTFATVIPQLVIHMLCIGLPIALVVRRFSK
jgi:hypothetical protein